MHVNKTAFSKLQHLMSGMDIPAHRYEIETLSNIQWLHKNLPIRNSSHRNYKDVMALITNLLKGLK